jgi:hypothetical protein
MKIRLTKKEGALLIDQLDIVLQGMSDALEHMETDPTTFDSIDEFVETVGQAIEDRETITNIRTKVQNAL